MFVSPSVYQSIMYISHFVWPNRVIATWCIAWNCSCSFSSLSKSCSFLIKSNHEGSFSEWILLFLILTYTERNRVLIYMFPLEFLRPNLLHNRSFWFVDPPDFIYTLDMHLLRYIKTFIQEAFPLIFSGIFY